MLVWLVVASLAAPAAQARSEESGLNSRTVGQKHRPMAGTENAPLSPSSDPALFVIDPGASWVNVPQTSPAIAFNGHEYFVVWQDNQASGNGDIYGARYDSLGHLIDTLGISVATGPAPQLTPVVAAVDSFFLVVWSVQGTRPQSDVYAARVNAAGQLLDPAGIRVVTRREYSERPAISGGDSCWLVCWTDIGLRGDIRAARVSRAGRVLDPGGFVVAADTANQSAPAVTSGDSTFLVAWQTDRFGVPTVRGSRVTQAGVVLDPGGLPIGGDASQGIGATIPAATSNGQDYFVGWQTTQSPSVIYGTRVSSNGIVRDWPINMSPHSAAAMKNPSVVLDGRDYLIAWEDYRTGTSGIYGARVNARGELLDSLGCRFAPTSAAQTKPALAAGAQAGIAVWTDSCAGTRVPVVRGILIDSSAVSQDAGFRVPRARYYCQQSAPAITGFGDGYFACWEESDSSGSDMNVVGAKLTSEGALQSRRTIAASVYKESMPAAAALDSTIFVVYTVNGGIRGKRFSGVPASPDSADILIPGTGTAPDIVAGDTCFLVVWEVGGSQSDIRAVRVTSSGAILDTYGLGITDARGELHYPAVAFDGTNFLIVWQWGYSICGARVTQRGRVLDPDVGFQIYRSSYNDYLYNPDVAFDGTNYLVTWSDDGDWIAGARVTPAAEVLDPQPIYFSEGYYDEGHPAMAFDGLNYSLVCDESYWGDGILVGSMIDADCAIVDTFTVSPPEGQLLHPALTRGPNNRVLLACAGPAVGIGGRDTLGRILAGFVTLPTGAKELPSPSASRSGLAVAPNPFTHLTHIHLGIGPGKTNCAVISDVSGRIRRKIDLRGVKSLTWDGCDEQGRELPAGVYFLTVRIADRVVRCTLTKLESQ